MASTAKEMMAISSCWFRPLFVSVGSVVDGVAVAIIVSVEGVRVVGVVEELSEAGLVAVPFVLLIPDTNLRTAVNVKQAYSNTNINTSPPSGNSSTCNCSHIGSYRK